MFCFGHTKLDSILVDPACRLDYCYSVGLVQCDCVSLQAKGEPCHTVHLVDNINLWVEMMNDGRRASIWRPRSRPRWVGYLSEKVPEPKYMMNGQDMLILKRLFSGTSKRIDLNRHVPDE